MARDPVREAFAYAWAAVAAGALSLGLLASWLASWTVWQALGGLTAVLGLLPHLAGLAGLACWGSWACVPSAADRRPSRPVVVAGALLSALGMAGPVLVIVVAGGSSN